jgi:hypothetical protein
MSFKRLLAAGLLMAAVAVPAALSSTPASDLDAARQATAPFRDVEVAKHAGYGEFRDAQGIACIENPGVGTMGIHYVKGELVGDTVLDPERPEALVYEPRPHGQLRLVALEYIVFQEAWDKENAHPPTLFGQEFMLVPAGNRYGIPAFYELHAWIWKSNPRGLFDDWNPRVSCRFA